MTHNIDAPEDGSALQRLVDKYPRLFHGQHPEVLSCIPTGWSSLMDHLCGQIDRIIRDSAHIKVLQIKEKFGGLRFYFSLKPMRAEQRSIIVDHNSTQAQSDGGFEWIARRVRAVVVAADLVSVGTCVRCGAAGRMCYFLPSDSRGNRRYFTEGDPRIAETAGLGLFQIPMCDTHAEARGRGET